MVFKEMTALTKNIASELYIYKDFTAIVRLI